MYSGIEIMDLLRKNYLQAVSEQISHCFYGPLKNVVIEKPAIIEFMIESDGTIFSVSILESSGLEIVDLAAIQACELGSPVMAVPHPLSMLPLKIRMVLGRDLPVMQLLF